MSATAMKGRLICVSNRVAVPGRSASPGGLAVGVSSALRATGGLWFGWGGELTSDTPEDAVLHSRDGVTFATIDLPRIDFNLYYNGFANESLWPLFHLMPARFRFRHEEREAYERINALFAARLLPLLRDGDDIWVHDYQLIPLGRRLRESGVDARIGFFLHTPFPHLDTLRVLPTYAELLRDLLAYDVVGFQTHGDLDSFLTAVQQVFGENCSIEGNRIEVGPRFVRCDVFPIGVDVDQIQKQAVAARAGQPVRRMIESLHGRQLIVGVDRLDYSKGLPERFAAYEEFLEMYPETRRRITYLQIAPLSRKDVQTYAQIRAALEQASGRTNGRFADADWTPIRYLNRNFPHQTLMGFLRVAQVGVVTPLRDGMNLVAKEYLAAQDPENPGVLILSTLAGAAVELTAALQINPYDPRALAHALQSALSMPLQERRERHAQLLKVLRENSIGAWTRAFLTALREPVQIVPAQRVPA